MAISIVELPALILLLAASPPAAPTRHGCQTAAAGDVDCCIHLAAWDGPATRLHYRPTSAQPASPDERKPSDVEVR
ncbi:hypothetical protein E5A73_20175 [Sphingomonas gei]|uniref:Secreted protein n=1 Tax=Sphingomonas gei TaxID=1395960 RepID=A0A4S1X4D7_9SPHN|nr:hypothetical protein [Sphingomonas gei]TGX49156.1 hypothetical protein E5A73_20175 [Sphingomonas gei]